ncbi:hypothetical protein [Geodermatophilus marinus]|uniref:hypothetical protein n=1 Tax=Geodermatophilus sp. LHW52908 TaxID=2303986 RepID=UPI000E3E75A2|nr:hypothetical protein [Geodermatophilus sp. LHW52908]RFU20365.1 hypothetical protein D0Z06_16650 [Geodermatophilus sp. LHW52908]
MTDPHTTGRRTADELVALLSADDHEAADALLAGVPTIRELVYVGAGLTGIARTESRRLPPAQRAQATTRHLHLGILRDRNRSDLDGLRVWLRRSAEEVVLIRSQLALAERFAG